MNRIARASFSQSQLVQKSTVFPSRLRGYGCSIVPVSQILQNHVKLSPNKRSFFGFCSCSLNEDLSNKKCVPCESKDIRPMLEQSAQELLPKIPGWSLVNEDGKLKLQRSWKVKTFTKGLEFFHAVADLAEAEGHHPDLHLVGWNNVKIEIWTHSVGGLTENDFILAAKINSLDLQHLLRRKPAA
ncbi:pterin-4-alpha-carbinolamine dehydratase 2, mitochondrial [Aristolochia californica]|uniref:pterin-4-alpha-carbinolamine dehydratase 2, mitochondrial n=1 Tax=Aristolochia californica TaxID=171875 RepID=UPI0035DA1F02